MDMTNWIFEQLSCVYCRCYSISLDINCITFPLRMSICNTNCPFCVEQFGEGSFVLDASPWCEHEASTNCIKKWMINVFPQFLPNQKDRYPIFWEMVDELLYDGKIFWFPFLALYVTLKVLFIVEWLSVA